MVGAMERVLLPFEKRLPSTGIKRLLVTPEMVADPQAELAKVLESPNDHHPEERLEAAGSFEAAQVARSLSQRAKEIEAELNLIVSDDLIDLVMTTYGRTGLDVDLALSRIKERAEEVRKFERELDQDHELRAVFDDEALYTILRVADQAEMSPTRYLDGIKPELIPGLKLVRDKTGLDEFILTREAIINTSDYVKGLVATRLPLGV